MAKTQIAAENLREGTTVAITGKVAYCRIARPIVGQEVADRAARSKSMYPIKDDHILLDLYDVQVHATGVDAQGNPAFTTEEFYVAERCYQSSSDKRPGNNYTIEVKGTRAPAFLHLDPSGSGQYVQEVDIKGELAQGAEITAVLNVFKPKNHPKRGLGLQVVAVKETQIPYYGGNQVSNEVLGNLGIALSGPLQPSTVSGQAAEGGGGDNAASGANPDAGMPGPAAPTAGGTLTPSPAAQQQYQQQQAAQAQPQAQQYQAPVAQAQPQQAQQPQYQPQQAQQPQYQAPAQQPQYQPPVNQQQQGSAFDGAPHNQGSGQPGISFDL